ncbi:MAG: Fe-S-containing hydro-lyase [Aquificaceae bacterium]|nr:Fe-S-containing hydro-lyase [Aquificaceae bacterium]
MEKKITTPLTEEVIQSLRAGDKVLITGYIYTARDAAHKRMVEALQRGEPLPIDVKGQVIYYVGPTPPKPGQVIGSAGPTTSTRMDKYTEALLKLGLKGMIGKGYRSPQVKELLKKYKAVYFAAVGGVAVLLSKSIKSSEVIAYEDLGTEAIRRLYVEDFPVIVANDVYGGDVFEEGRKRFARIDV